MYSGLWLVLGLLQMFLIQGCMGNASSDQSPAASKNSTEQNTLNLNNDESRQPTTSTSANARVSRAFFERSLAGKVRVHISNAANLPDEQESDVLWEERPEAADHEGCLRYAQTGNVSICFNVMSDVTSVGLNNEEAALRGVNQILQAMYPTDCEVKARSIRLTQAKTTEQDLHASFLVDIEARGNCKSEPVLIELSARQI